jgi:hypothetical membrane protein
MKPNSKLQNNRDKLHTMAALAGILAPILYIGMVIILGLLEPGYSQRTMMMSILGAVQGWRGAIFNLGLVLIGVSLIVFGFGLHRNVNQGKGNRLGLILLIIAGAGLMGSGYYHCDVGCINIIQEPDFRGQMHMLFAFITGLSLAFSPLPFFFSMKYDSRWKNYRGMTLAAVILSNIPGIIMWITLFTTRLPEWEGAIQRLGLVFPLIWVEVMAIKLLYLPKVDPRVN